MNQDDQQKQKTGESFTPVTSSGLGREKEPLQTFVESHLTELGKEQEISQEVQQAGVVKKQEKIEISQDLEQLGAHHTGFETLVSFQPTLKLPLADEKIEKGLHESMLKSIRWFSEWCKFQLKRAHLALKVIRGIVRRVRI